MFLPITALLPVDVDRRPKTRSIDLSIFCHAYDARLSASRVGFCLAANKAVTAGKGENMSNLSAGNVEIATDGRARSDEEEMRLQPWLEDCLDQLEGKVARKESLDSREYYALIASLLA